MEKYYIVTNENFIEEAERYDLNMYERNEFFKRFADENGIDGNEYYFAGDGSVNCPFNELDESDIYLSISSTENNLEKFSGQFLKSKRFDTLSDFKKSSKLLKNFQEECVDKRVVINPIDVSCRDYLNGVRYVGFKYNKFKHNDSYYLYIEPKQDVEITPKYEGFKEIKASEYYLALEGEQNKRGEK